MTRADNKIRVRQGISRGKASQQQVRKVQGSRLDAQFMTVTIFNCRHRLLQPRTLSIMARPAVADTPNYYPATLRAGLIQGQY